MSHPPAPNGSSPPELPYPFPFKISYERRLPAPGAEWVPIFRCNNHPGGYTVNLPRGARSLVLGRHAELDGGVVHLRVELHPDRGAARAAAEVARAHFAALGYPDTRTRVQGVEVEEAAAPGREPPLAAIAMLAAVHHPQENPWHRGLLPWISRLDRRPGTRHAVVGLTHEFYLFLAEVSDCLCPWDDGQLHQWRFAPASPAHAGKPERALLEALRPAFHLCGRHHRPVAFRVGATEVRALNLLTGEGGSGGGRARHAVHPGWALLFGWTPPGPGAGTWRWATGRRCRRPPAWPHPGQRRPPFSAPFPSRPFPVSARHPPSREDPRLR